MSSEENKKKRQPLDPGGPATEIAREALEGRLKKVWRFAKLSATRAEEDVEYVHKVRVFTRRVTASLEALETMLPRSRVKKMSKLLRILRRAAGDARDLDVLSERIRAMDTGDGERDPRVVDFLAELERRRREAQIPLVRAYAKLLEKDFQGLSSRVLDDLEWPEGEKEPTFAGAARLTLAPVVAEFLGAARADLEDIDGLHQLRIHAKRVRYMLELFGDAFGEAFRADLRPRFMEFQDRLGEINDHATAGSFFGAWIAEIDSGADTTVDASLLRELLEEEERLLASTSSSFRVWWTPERVDDLETRFAELLENPHPGSLAAR